MLNSQQAQMDMHKDLQPPGFASAEKLSDIFFQFYFQRCEKGLR